MRGAREECDNSYKVSYPATWASFSTSLPSITVRTRVPGSIRATRSASYALLSAMAVSISRNA